MAGTPLSESLGPFVPGMNNRRPDFSLRDKESGQFVRSAVNAEFTTEGSIKRRTGYQSTQAGADCHSLWSDSTATYGFYVDGQTLYRVEDAGAGLRRSALRSDMLPAARVSYAEVNGSVYYSNYYVIGRADSTGDHACGVPVPSPAPAAVAGAANSGGLAAAKYQISFTAVNSDGEISGATYPITVDVPASGSIVLSSLPATLTRYYITEPNGSTLYAGGYLIGSSSYTLTALPALGGICPTLWLTQMPPGQIVRFLNGRLYVARDNVLHYSEPFAPALYNPGRNYILFPSPITVVEPCVNGLYVVADKTYWLAGDPTKAELQVALPYGAALYASVSYPHLQAAVWMSHRGLVRGDASGQVVNLQESAVAVDKPKAGAVYVRERDGKKLVVATVFGTAATTMSADSAMSAEIIRKGTLL